MQPVCTAISTPCHAGRGLAGHPWCISVVNEHGKTSLFPLIRSKTTALPRCARQLSAQRRHSCPPCRGDEFAGKRSHRNHSSGFYSRYFLIPKKDGSLRPILDLKLLNYAMMKRSFRMITLKKILSQICLGDWFISLDLKDTYIHIQIVPLSQVNSSPPITGEFLRFTFKGVAYQYQVLPFVLSLATRTGNLHTQLRRRLAYFGPVTGGFDITQDPPPQPLRLPGAKGQLCQEHTVIQPKGIVPGYSNRLGADDSYCLSGASHHNSASRCFLQGRHRPSAQSFPEDAGPYGSGFKSSQVTFIYIALLTIQIVTKHCTISK